jgi:spore coat polysaccharide biosynthesis protein SpsF (cytidylyltransferase family)
MHVLIGIQARSGSTRLPRKAFELIAGRTMLDRVIDTCRYAAKQIDKSGHRCDVVVVTPSGDPIVEEFQSRVDIVEGPERDVLARYKIAVDKYQPDFLVRITGDCPLIPGSLITYMTMTGISRGYDYYSNSDERFRTAIDGSDCEVMSRQAIDYVAEEAVTAYDREHVTPFLRRDPAPSWLSRGLAFNNFDVSDIKLSVDTKEDLERVRRAYEQSFVKYQEAVKVYGRGAVHRL